MKFVYCCETSEGKCIFMTNSFKLNQQITGSSRKSYTSSQVRESVLDKSVTGEVYETV